MSTPKLPGQFESDLGEALHADDHGWTPLHHAVFGPIGEVAALVQSRVDLEATTSGGSTALELALGLALSRRVHYAFSEGTHGSTPVSYTVELGVMTFRKRGRAVKMKRGDELTVAPMFCAEHVGFVYALDHVETLCKKADLSSASVLQMLADLAHPSLDKVLAKRGVTLPPRADRVVVLRPLLPLDPSMATGAALLDATEAGDEAKVRALLDAGAPALTEDNGWTMLHLACQQGLGSAVHWALEAGIEPGRALPNGFTPLHIAIESAQNRPLNYTVTLTRNGEQVALTEPDAIRAAIGSHPDDEYATKVGIATLLLECGADVNALTTDGQSPANHAAARGVEDVLRQLIERGADLDVRDRFGLTALHMACRNGHTGSVSLLLAAGAGVSVGDEYGFTALHEAAENGRLDVIPLLLAGGADRNQGNHKPYRTIVAGTTPAQLAIAKNKADAAQLLTS